MTTAVMITAPVESTPFDERAARREGWLIAGCGTDDAGRRRVELQRLDDPQDDENTFPDDADAWKHVADRAGRGSVLHLQALALVDPIERALIEQRAGH
ncbi:MAG: hypothetical protein ACRYGM_22280 [Janthinobacterium lividum]